MDEKELRDYYLEKLILLLIGLILFCIAMGLIYIWAVTPRIPEMLNDCTKEIVGNCIIK